MWRVSAVICAYEVVIFLLIYVNIFDWGWDLNLTNEFSYQPSGLLSVYNNVTSVCILIDCWSWSIKGHTHRWRQMHPIRSCCGLVFLFSCPRKPSINYVNFLYKRNRLHFPVRVYCNRSEKISLRVKNNWLCD